MRRVSKLDVKKIPTRKKLAQKQKRRRLGLIDENRVRVAIRLSKVALDAIDEYVKRLNVRYDKINRTRLIELGIFMVTKTMHSVNDDIDAKFKKYWKE